MAKIIKNRVSKTGLVDWKKVLDLQPENAKIKYNLQALKRMIVKHGLAKASDVWQDPKTKKIYWVDGHTRKQALLELQQEGYKIPSKIHAVFVKASNKKQAIEFLIEVHNIKQNPFNDEVLYEWLEVEEIELEEIEVEVLSFDNDSFANQFGNINGEEQPDAEKGEAEPAKSGQEPKKGGDGIQASHVKMIQLFMSTKTEPLFRQYEQQVRSYFESDNLSDTIYQAMKWVSENKNLIDLK